MDGCQAYCISWNREERPDLTPERPRSSRVSTWEKGPYPHRGRLSQHLGCDTGLPPRNPSYSWTERTRRKERGGEVYLPSTRGTPDRRAAHVPIHPGFRRRTKPIVLFPRYTGAVGRFPPFLPEISHAAFSDSGKWLEERHYGAREWLDEGGEGGLHGDREMAHHLGIESRFCSEACLVSRWSVRGGGREGGKVRCWLGLWGIVYACTMGVGPVSGSGFRSCGLLVSWAARCSGWGS